MIKDKSYGERLRAFVMPSLVTIEFRRKCGGMISTFKILTDFMDTDPSLLFELKQKNTRRGEIQIDFSIVIY